MRARIGYRDGGGDVGAGQRRGRVLRVEVVAHDRVDHQLLARHTASHTRLRQRQARKNKKSCTTGSYVHVLRCAWHITMISTRAHQGHRPDLLRGTGDYGSL